MIPPIDTTTPPRGARRDPARDERLEILRMVESGVITAEEGIQLIDALDQAARPGGGGSDDPTRPIAGRNAGTRHVRVRVSDRATNRQKVNLVLPLGLIDAGLNVARRLAPDRIGDAEHLRDSIAGGFRGPLLDIEDGGDRVEIVVE